MDIACMAGKIQRFRRASELQISHLLFADDMLIFCRANKSSFKGIYQLLNSLANHTGLQANKTKSKIYFSKGCNIKGELCALLGISEGKFHTKYLGLPLSINYPKARHFLPLIDKLRSMIDGWMVKTLSFAGRLELIKTVLFNILSYWFQSYVFPCSIVREIERILSNFLWNGKLHTMSWAKICLPKAEGGFGLRRVSDVCAAATIKKVWRLLTTKTIWSEWIAYRYFRNLNLWEAHTHSLDSGTWKHINSVKSKALAYMFKQIGNGNSTSVWFDPWLPEGRLSDIIQQGPSPHLSYSNDWKVRKLLISNQWSFNIPILNPMMASILNIRITEDDDIWNWTYSSDGKFSLHSAWDSLREHAEEFPYYKEIWFPSNTPKMASCLLKGMLDRLPTRERLKKFNITNTDSCVLCEDGTENINHLFFACSYSSYIWSLCRLKLQLPNSHIGNLLQEAELIKSKFKIKDRAFILSRLAFNACVWHIWQERNRRIFQLKNMHKVFIFRRIYEDINVLLQTCNWKTNGRELLLSNWGL
jgi:hypothetical protein